MINDLYPDGAAHTPVNLLKLLLSDFGLSENTIEKYLSEYGEEFESWFVGYIDHKQFRPHKVRIEALERMAKTKRDSAVALEGYREQYPPFESLYKEDSFSFDSESMLFPDEVFEWVESKEMDRVPLLKFEEFVMFHDTKSVDMLIGMLDVVIGGVFNTGGVLRARLEVLAEHMLMHLAEHREHVPQNYLEAFENDVKEWASAEYMAELREAMMERAVV